MITMMNSKKKQRQKMAISSKKQKMVISSSPSSSSSYLFNLLHEDLIIEEILLKLPVSSLLRLRCVSRYFHSLITSPSFIKKHLHHSSAQLDQNLVLISSRSSSQYVLCTDKKKETKEYLFRHYACNFSSTGDDDLSRRPQVVKMRCPFEFTGIQASCNGLLFLHKFFAASEMKMDRGYIWNPCTKEYKEVFPPSRIQEHLFEGIQVLPRLLPTMLPLGCSSGFCGFGYDCTNDEYKILYYETRVGHLPLNPDLVPITVFEDLVSITEFKVYKLGTNTWTSIRGDHNPYRSLFFGHLWPRIGLYMNGALHWIMSSSSSLSSSFICARNAKIISFCMEKEEFREIQKPYHLEVQNNPYYYSSTSTLAKQEFYRYGGLHVLQGCLCICECPPGFGTVDIWMLKDYAKDSSWTKLFTVMISRDWDWIPDSYFGLWKLSLLRLCKNGEIVMTKDNHRDVIVYDPVKHISRPVENLNLDKAIQEGWTWIYEVIYVKSLVSLNSGTYMS